MKKKEVLEWPPCPPPKFLRTQENSKPINLMAKSQIIMSEGHDILNIDIYHDQEGLKVRYFADNETDTFRALILPDGVYKRISLRNAICQSFGSLSRDKWTCFQIQSVYWGDNKFPYSFETKEDGYRVRQYLGEDIDYWETGQEHRRFLKEEERKRIRIAGLMNYLIPEIPEDFEEWVIKTAFDREYLFASECRKMVRYKCTSCGCSFIRKEKPKLICPKCKAKLAGIRKAEVNSKWDAFYLLQKNKDGHSWVERKFSARREWKPEGSSLDLVEEIRVIIPEKRTWGVCYYGMGRTDDRYFWDRNTASVRLCSGYIYPGSIEDVMTVWEDDLRHMGMNILAAQKVRINVNHIIQNSGLKLLEYMIKGDFYKLAVEWMNYGKRFNPSYLNNNGETAGEVLRLDAGRINRLRQVGGGHVSLGWLQYEKTMGGKISMENLAYLEKKGIDKSDSTVWKILHYIKKAEVFVNYLKKQAKIMKMGPNHVISEWADYLDMAEKQGLDLEQSIFSRPKDLKAFHDERVRIGQEQAAEKRRKEILEKFPDVEKVMETIKDKYEYQAGKYMIRVPASVTDVIVEGRTLGHCIDSTDRYFDRIQNRETFLVFLRKSAAPDRPWYTLEIEPGGTIRQQRTVGNKQCKEDVKAYMPFIIRWQQEVKERLTEEDKAMAESSRKARILEYRQLREKKEAVWHGPLAGKLLADVLEADLIEA